MKIDIKLQLALEFIDISKKSNNLKVICNKPTKLYVIERVRYKEFYNIFKFENK